MKTFSIINKIKKIYGEGENIISFLNKQDGLDNTSEKIMISYDLQAGSYTILAEKNPEYFQIYTDAVKSVIDKLGKFNSIMEVGVGEATVMNPLISKLDPNNQLKKLGFDISWSRVRYAKENSEKARNDIDFFIADLFEIPLSDSSIDIVYTSHSIEPNGGREKDALRELYRIAGKYIVLLEPDYESANIEGKKRMEHHGYVRYLGKHAIELGYDVIIDRPFEIFANPLNPTRLTVIKKNEGNTEEKLNYVCPISKNWLEKIDNIYFENINGLIYPVVGEIPVFLSSSAILGTHLKKFSNL